MNSVGDTRPLVRVMPADQRFQSADAPRREIHLGLIVEHELALAHGLAQAALEEQPLRHARVHLGRVEQVGLRRVLGALERGLGVDEQGFRGLGIRGIQREADLHRGAQFDVVDHERFCERLDDLVLDPADHGRGR